jgi:hypothetical protein
MILGMKDALSGAVMSDQESSAVSHLEKMPFGGGSNSLGIETSAAKVESKLGSYNDAPYPRPSPKTQILQPSPDLRIASAETGFRQGAIEMVPFNADLFCLSSGAPQLPTPMT